MTTKYPVLIRVNPTSLGIDTCLVCQRVTVYECVTPTEDGLRWLHCCSIECYQTLREVDAKWRRSQNEWLFAMHAV